MRIEKLPNPNMPAPEFPFERKWQEACCAKAKDGNYVVAICARENFGEDINWFGVHISAGIRKRPNFETSEFIRDVTCSEFREIVEHYCEHGVEMEIIRSGALIHAYQKEPKS